MKATLQMVNEAHDISDARVIAQDEGFLVYSDDIGGEEGALAWALTEDDALVSAVRDSENREPYVRMLREALRVEMGPSIDDVREVWDDPRMVTRWCGAGIGHKCSWSVRAGGTVPWVPSDTFGDTEREALQAAYDAGVERRKGDGA